MNYEYKRKDGGSTSCYGTITEGSNFEVTCDNEYNDGIATDITLTSWQQVCEYLEKNYNSKIEQLVTC